MTSVVVVIPSRGRPARAREAVEAVRASAALVSTSVVLAVDAEDPAWYDYADLRFPGFGASISLVTLQPGETGDLVKATNTVSMRIARDDPDVIIGNLGDDHLVRTFGWDKKVADALAEPGIAYGDDLVHGERLPTAPFISARIVLALGWYALPTCRHLYIDDAWRELGKGIGRLRYLPDLVIEHMHPGVGKREWDEGYRRANSREMTDRDHAAYLAWLKSRFSADVRNVKRTLARAA